MASAPEICCREALFHSVFATRCSLSTLCFLPLQPPSQIGSSLKVSTYKIQSFPYVGKSPKSFLRSFLLALGELFLPRWRAFQYAEASDKLTPQAKSASLLSYRYRSVRFPPNLRFLSRIYVNAPPSSPLHSSPFVCSSQ